MIATATAEAVSLIKHEAFIRIVGLALRQNAAGHVSEGSFATDPVGPTSHLMSALTLKAT